LSDIDCDVFSNNSEQEFLAEPSHKTSETAEEHSKTPNIGFTSQLFFIPSNEQREEHLCDKEAKNWEYAALNHRDKSTDYDINCRFIVWC
jgi:hypothetical protein